MYEKFHLPNGVLVALDRFTGVRSASLGIWLNAGSRCERGGEHGAAHFIEHMLFKGTHSRTSAELAEDMDSLGAEFNAYTSRDCTSYYFRVLDKNLPGAAAILGDMFLNSRFDPADMDTERGVILDEIRMYDDMPDDVANELLVRTCFPGALGAPVLGSRESVMNLSRETLLRFLERQYIPENIAVTVAGNFSPCELDSLLLPLSELHPSARELPEPAAYTPGISVVRRDTEQNQLLLAFPGITYGSADRCALALMNAILGGWASSTLYRRVRDELGLCYDLESFDMTWSDTGLVGIGAATSPDNESTALEAIISELRRFLDTGPDEAELSRAKAQAESGAVLALESTIARMRRLGQDELFLGGCEDIDALLERFKAVTCEDVLSLARRVFDFGRLSCVALGAVQDEEYYSRLRETR